MKISRLDIIIRTRSDDSFHSVSNICSNVTMYSSCNSSDGRVEFDMMDIPTVNCRFGDQITLNLDSEVVFQGKLFSITRTSNIYVRHYIFYDESYYLRNQISYPVPTKIKMVDLVKGLLDKYEIYYARIDDSGEEVSERKIQSVSVLDAITDIVNYITYMYDKMYVLRQNKGSVEFIDIEAANVHGFKDSYPLVIDFYNNENICEQTYNYFEFYKRDDKKAKTSKEPKPTKPEPKKDGYNQNDTNEMQNIAKGNLPEDGKSTNKSKTVTKYLKPLVPYEQQKINMEIAMYALGGINSATAKSETEGKPDIISDLDSVKKGYDIGSKGYKLTGEVALWGYLPMIKEVPEIPPEEVINKIINVRRNPIRKARFTVLVHTEFHLPGDKLFIGENEEIASVYVINSVTTRFSDEGVIQELDIFSWQKTYEIQKLIFAESIKKLEKQGGIEAVQSFAAKNNINLLYKDSVGSNDAGFVITDKVWADWKAEHGMDAQSYFDFMENKVSALEKKAETINPAVEKTTKGRFVWKDGRLMTEEIL